MATPDVSPAERAAELRQRILQHVGAATWRTADDLNRMSLEAMAYQADESRVLPSTGVIHLAGDGVSGSSARMSDIGDVMKNFQKMVTALGASRRGYTNLKGRIAADVTSLTNLRLMASPQVGSVVLNFIPEISPSDELRPEGQGQLGDPREQLADHAVLDALVLLESIKEVGPDADGSDFLQSVSTRGARAATAIRDFAKSLADSSFTTDLEWRAPGESTVRTSLTREQADLISRTIVGQELDKEETFIDGTLRTVSDMSSLIVETSDGFDAIDKGDLSPDTIQKLTVGARVRVSVEMTVQRRPGGVDVPKYKATSITLLTS